MPDWSPGTYELFRDERSRPFFDLLALLAPIPGGRAVDLGCGTGELTAVLHRELGLAETLGIDTSAAMLAKTAPAPGLRFERADIATWRPATPVDLVFSNAALQWLPDHEALFARIAGFLAPGGTLAVQMPANHEHASHTVARRVAAEEPFRSALGGWSRAAPLLTPSAYSLLLDALGLRDVRVRLEVYLHHLQGPESVVDWVRGTLLTAYEARLPAELWQRFLDRYREALLAELPALRPYPYAFPRILFTARR